MALIIDPIDVGSSVPDERNVDELTTVALDGTGVFDVLMRSVKLHLTEEYDNSRIVGKEYATVYLGAMTAVMQQAVGYLLNNSQIDQLAAQIGLIRQQTVTELTKTSENIPTGLAFNDSIVVEGQVALDKELVTAQTTQVTTVTGDQHDKTISDIDVNDQSILKLVADINNQTGKTTSDIGVNTAQVSKMGTDSEDQRTKLNSDVLVNTASVSKLEADITNQTNKTVSDILVNDEQIIKMDGEVLLLGQKTITELAQTDDTVPSNAVDPGNVMPWLNTSTAVLGAISQQNLLYTAQTDGFARDAEQKMAKIMVDSWSVQMGAGLTPPAESSGLSDTDIRSVIQVAREGAGSGENLPPLP